MADNENLDSDSSDEKILEIARQRFDLAVEAEREIRVEALDDLKFSAGDQWPDDVKNSRNQEMRPCLTINRLPQFIHQLTNDQRQNRPSIKVNPFDDNADVETAKVFQGLIRHIEYNSNADVAYDTAFDGAVRGGFGYFRLITDFCDPESFDQEILVKAIRNPFSVYLDPNRVEPDGSDSNWGFIFEDMSIDDYRAQYKDSKLADMNEWRSLGDSSPDWVADKTVRVAEYFYKTFREVELVLLADHKGDKQVLRKNQMPKNLPEGMKILDERTTVLPAIKWAKINAIEILQKRDWAGQWIPIIPLTGDELIVDGKRIVAGIVRHAKDPQRMYNYFASAEAEAIALAPKAPYIIAEGQLDGYEEFWQTANTKNHAYLPYTPTSLMGQPVAPPQRNTYEPAVQAITQARGQSSEEIKATTAMYDASLGNRSNENSGIAIQRRNQQAQTSNFHFIDNLSRALRHAGRQIVDLVPKIYDMPRTVRILGEDGTPEMVAINQVFQKNGQDKSHFLGAGKYDVVVATGPSYATKRQEAVASMLDLTKAYPQVAQVAGDIMVRNMDWPGSQEIADRLKKMLPPGIADDKDQKQQPIPPQAKQQMQQMNQMIQQLTQHLTAANHKIDAKTIELESKERIAMAQIQANIEIAMGKMGSEEAQTLLMHQIDEINQRMALLHESQPIDDGNGMAAGASQPAPPNNQQPQPTGGQSPGSPMGV